MRFTTSDPDKAATTQSGSGGDGAVAWRASLQVNTPSARRIHYWVLPTGQVEVARVATHDDFDI